jgi:CheY-like chemotaxis protein
MSGPGDPARSVQTDCPLVLVVNDFEDARVIYQQYLTYRGHRVLTAISGTEAIETREAALPGGGLSPHQDGAGFAGPTERLLMDFVRDKISWSAFRRGYVGELFLDGPIDSRSKTIKNHRQKFTLRLLKRLARKGNDADVPLRRGPGAVSSSRPARADFEQPRVMIATELPSASTA